MGTSWGISWQNDSVDYLDFLRAVENSQPSGPEPEETDKAVLINFAKLGVEEVLKNIQKIVASSGPALSEVRLTAEGFPGALKLWASW